MKGLNVDYIIESEFPLKGNWLVSDHIELTQITDLNSALFNQSRIY